MLERNGLAPGVNNRGIIRAMRRFMGFRGSEGGVLILVSRSEVGNRYRPDRLAGLCRRTSRRGAAALAAAVGPRRPCRPSGDPAGVPPAAVWDKPTALMFSADAFAELEGPRPDFSSQDQRPPTATAMPSSSMAANATGGFAWSAVVSEETLTDEIKDLKATAARAVSSQSEFKGAATLRLARPSAPRRSPSE